MRVLFWLIFLCAATPMLCGAAAFPLLESPAVYSGGAESEGVRYDVTLVLNTNHLFILRERIAWTDGNLSERTLTGVWLQVREGSLLRLMNRNGLQRVFNIGGSGCLYGGVHSPFLKYMNVTLRKGGQIFPYTIIGILTFEGSTAILQDTATNKAYPLSSDTQLEQLRMHGERLFIDADVEENGSSLRIVRIRSSTNIIPQLPQNTPERFQRLVPPMYWRVTVNGLPFNCTFHKKTMEQGQLNLATDGIAFQISYRLKRDSIIFYADKKNRQMAEVFGLKKIINSFNGTSTWEVYKDILLLRRTDGALYVLENIS